MRRGLRAAFMAAESLFNRVFGDRLNPLYHLGAIAFHLFWLVAGSGLYLYAFFKTGVGEAYASVQSLTEAQWYAGGILRSVHRYASDGMVLSMALHLLRHWAFGRFRGFRAFSWLTGVALVGGVVASGVNGYMLPWDRLAQFVVVGNFEWLDRLPLFGGTLIRNFMYASSVNDRLFSLLAFMHIGLPLVVLLMMWVHVQRVPKVSTQPPRQVAVALTASLVLLSLLKPALSQGGPADVASAPGPLALDWFFLSGYPLLDLWPLAGVWAFVGVLTLLAVAVPWWPGGSRAAAHRMRVNGGARTFEVRAGETLLEAGLRQGLAMPYECRSGGCGQCRCTVRQGEVDRGEAQPQVLTDAQRAAGEALLCCAVPRTDVEIDVVLAAAPVKQWRGRVGAMERLAPEVMRVVVDLAEGERVAFTPGQYVHIVLPGGQRRAFSFANPPSDDRHLEMHVRRMPGGLFTTQVFERMKPGDEVLFEGPLGGFDLEEDSRPMLMVAGATGFAPVKCLLEDAFARGLHRPMTLYWGVRRLQDAYMADLADRWQREHPNFRWVGVVSDEPAPQGWRSGLVHEALLQDHPDLAGCEVYVCGSARMVEAAVPAFRLQGLAEDACASDAFLLARNASGSA